MWEQPAFPAHTEKRCQNIGTHRAGGKLDLAATRLDGHVFMLRLNKCSHKQDEVNTRGLIYSGDGLFELRYDPVKLTE